MLSDTAGLVIIPSPVITNAIPVPYRHVIDADRCRIGTHITSLSFRKHPDDSPACCNTDLRATLTRMLHEGGHRLLNICRRLNRTGVIQQTGLQVLFVLSGFRNNLASHIERSLVDP